MAGKKLALLKQLRFLQLTLYMIFLLFAYPSFGTEWLFKLFSSIFFLNALLVSLSASGKTIRAKWLLWVLFGISMCFTALYLTASEPATRLAFLKLSLGSDILLLLLCLATILSFIFETTQVTVDTIFAAVVAYLLVAFTFAQAYVLIYSFLPSSFNLTIPTTPAAINTFHGEMIYYSFIVITTVGLGDIVPLTPLARAVTAVEAMVGQFFVAILVAWLVGRFITESSGHRPSD